MVRKYEGCVLHKAHIEDPAGSSDCNPDTAFMTATELF